MVFLTFFFIIATLIEIYATTSYYLSPSSAFDHIYINSFFFSVSHVAITFLLLMNVPNLKSWVKTFDQNGFNLFIIKSFIIFISFLAFFIIVGMSSSDFFLKAKIFLLLLLQKQHIIYQTYGVSRVYDSEYSSTLFKEKNRMILKFERIAIFLFFTTSVASSTIILTGFTNYLIFDVKLKTLFLSASVLFFLVVIFLAMIQRISSKRSNKFVHLLNFIHIPLANFSFISNMASNVMHAFEYLFVSNRVIDNSLKLNKKYLKLMSISLLVILGSIYSVYTYFEDISYKSNGYYSNGFIVFNSFTYAIGITHYYIDKCLFSTGDSLNKQHILPLLVKNNE